MDDSNDDAHTRKPAVITTPKQSWLSHSSAAGLGALIVFLTPYFQTKEAGSAQGTAIVVNANQLSDLKSLMNENKRDIIEKINDVAKPVISGLEKHETRIVNLEFLQMQKKGK